MKAIVNRKELINMVSQARLCAPVRAALPVIQNVLITADGKFRVSALNLEQRVEVVDKARKVVKVSDRAKVAEQGSVLVNPKMLLDTLKGLREDKVQLSTKGNELIVEAGGSQTKLTVDKVEDYPPNPEFDEGYRFVAVNLAEGLGKVAQAIATEDSRPVLSAACLTIKEGKAQVAGADGFRLAIADLKVKKLSDSLTVVAVQEESVPHALQILIPLSAVVVLRKLFVDAETVVTVSKDKKQAVFEREGISLKTQLVQGTFPNFSQLIPTDPAFSCKVSTADLLQAVKLVKSVAKDGKGIIRLAGSKGKLNVWAKSEEMAVSESVISCKGDIKIAANCVYLEEMLKVLEGEYVTLQTSTPSSPLLVKEPGYVWVCMPMFVAW